MAPDTGGRVDLEQLKQRLSRLGVHIDTVPGENPSDGRHRTLQVQAHAEPSAALLRGSDEVTRLLERCKRIESALHSPHHDRTQRSSEATTYHPAAVTSTAAASLPSPPAAAAASRDATTIQHTQQARRSASPGPPPAAAVRRAAAGTGSSGPVRGRSAATFQQQQAAAQQRHDARGSPLATVLAQYKEAQAAWAHEKARLRRDAVSSRKRAAALELELARQKQLAAHRGADCTTLKAALKGRDVALADAHAKVKALEEALAKAHEVAAEKLCSLAAERDDLQALLMATLQRLEAVEGAVARADASSAAMEDKVHELEHERLAALEVAAAARGEVEALSAAQAKLQWQSKLLEKMSQVQTQHNKRKSAAIRELLEQDAVAAAVGGGGDGDSVGGGGATRGGGLRHADLFAGILAGRAAAADGGGGSDDSSEEGSTEAGSMLGDLAPLLQALKS